MDIQAIRRDFPALEQYTWFQNGGVSITPVPVAAEYTRWTEEIVRRGPLHIVYPEEEYPRRKAAMERLAQFFGAAAGELALMRGVSEGFQTVVRGMEWAAGDEIVISADEEAALLLPALHLRDVYGVEVVKVPLIDDDDGQVQAVEERLGERTKLVALSHVTTDLGYRLPVERICAGARARGVRSFVDLAHSAGLYPLDLHALGCDFAGLLSYKWMYAPYAAGIALRAAGGPRRGAGALCWRASRTVVGPGGGHFRAARDGRALSVRPLVLAAGAILGLCCRVSVGHWAGGDLGADGGVGWAAEGRAGADPGCSALHSALPAAVCGAGQLWAGGMEGEELSQALRAEWNMVIKPLPHGREGLRASIAFFLLEAEIDELLAALGSLAKQRS